MKDDMMVSGEHFGKGGIKIESSHQNSFYLDPLFCLSVSPLGSLCDHVVYLCLHWAVYMQPVKLSFLQKYIRSEKLSPLPPPHTHTFSQPPTMVICACVLP